MADGLLPPDEIKRLLRKYSDPATRTYIKHVRRGSSSNRVNLRAVAQMAGMRYEILWRCKTGRLRITERVQEVLSPIFRDIESGRIKFKAVGSFKDRWQIEFREPPGRPPPPQSRVIRADDYNEWARCASCGHPRFSSFTSDRLYYACDVCVTEPDRRMLGARYT